MFGGLRLKRTCLASNNKAIMASNIVCTGDHEHAPWSIHDGIFDTAREAKYTPQSIAGQFNLPNVSQVSKRLKLSRFHSIAAGKQPSKLTPLPAVPEFSHFLVMSVCLVILPLIYWMVVYNNALWCNWMALNFWCLVGASCFERQTERGERTVFLIIL